MSIAFALPEAHRRRLSDAADYLAIALVASLPWSTSATGVLAALWLMALLPTLDAASVQRILARPAGGLPALLFALAILGMLWANADWDLRFESAASHFKLVAIPLLFIQFQNSDRGRWAIHALLAACTALLAASYALALYQVLAHERGPEYGVVVKDYISQSGFFTLAAFVLLDIALARWREGRRKLACAIGALLALFAGNIVFVATGRTALLVIPALFLLYGLRRAGWKGAAAAIAAVLLAVMIVWPASPYLRERVMSTFEQEAALVNESGLSSTEQRLAFWRAGLEIVKESPVIGHGTGSISAQYRKYGQTHADPGVEIADNPHNQTLAVAMQLGVIGAATLCAMWLFHFLLFRGEGLAAWFGAVVVAQNFISSLVNSHLYDFTQGWTYAALVGIAGGMVLRRNAIREGEQSKPA